MLDEPRWTLARIRYSKASWDLAELPDSPATALQAKPGMIIGVLGQLCTVSFTLTLNFLEPGTEKITSAIGVQVDGLYNINFTQEDEKFRPLIVEITNHASQRLPSLAVSECIRIALSAGVEAPLPLIPGQFDKILSLEQVTDQEWDDRKKITPIVSKQSAPYASPLIERKLADPSGFIRRLTAPTELERLGQIAIEEARSAGINSIYGALESRGAGEYSLVFFGPLPIPERDQAVVRELCRQVGIPDIIRLEFAVKV